MIRGFDKMMEEFKTPAWTPKPSREKIDNTQLLKDTGLRILHIRKNSRDFPDNTAVRDMTIAFREGNSVIEIATAVVHPSDCFTRKIGTKLAVEAFLAGRTIHVPKMLDYGYETLRSASAIRSLCLMFGRI
jgi:hypothetical protein